MLKITHEEAIDKIYRANNNFIILSEFKGWREKIIRQCKVCGDIREVHARSLIELNKDGTTRGCMKCRAIERANNKRKTHEQFLKELHDVNKNIEILTEYISNNHNVKCRCIVDGYEWEAKPHSLLQNHGCPECARRKQNRRNEEEYLFEMQKKQPTIIPIGQFTQSKDEMLFKCTICDYEWKTQAYIPLARNGYSCPKCKGHASVTESEMIERLKEKNPFIEYISGYKGMQPHATFKCKNCECQWNASPANVLNGRGCPYCRKSRGERKIHQILIKMKIDFESQYKFDDCKNIRTLPFDFYIPSLNLCIEFDGVQHFEPTRFNKKMSFEQAEENFKNVQIRDEIKNKYCKDNNINLLRIPYTEFDNIEKILNEYLS